MLTLIQDEIVPDGMQATNFISSNFWSINTPSAKPLSGEFVTYLAGRYVEFIISPFSFKEFLSMPVQKDEAIASSFRKYL